jgi:hypothetical protein
MATTKKPKKTTKKTTRAPALDLTPEQIAAMKAVKDGADVYAYGIALRLREVQRAHPGLIDIGRAMSPPSNGAARQPYFGAILTKAGHAAIAR